MDWTQTLFIVASITGMMFFFTSKIDQDVRAQGQRIDQLYQMFVDLLKERK